MQNFGYAFSLRTKREHTTGSALKPPIHRVFKRRVYFEPLMVHQFLETPKRNLRGFTFRRTLDFQGV